ncbi:MAG TPA: hypothetical protein VGG48_15465 [Rhizomicrobium sp.]|jgi:hypothetical protein
MQPTDWINSIAHLGPWIVAVAAIIAWGFKSQGGREDRRQTDLLERIASKLDTKA